MNDALVLGIGNVLWADEGFGIRCVEALTEAWELPPGAVAMDGGTQGLYVAECPRSPDTNKEISFRFEHHETNNQEQYTDSRHECPRHIKAYIEIRK